MKTKILWVTFICGVLVHQTTTAQNQQSTKIVQPQSLAVEANFDPQTGKKKVVPPIEYFFDAEKTNCSNKACLGFVPIPAIWYQSENGKQEFFMATSGVSTGIMFRYRF